MRSDAQTPDSAEAASRAGRLVSICTGAFLLAATDPAAGRRIATHWRYADDLARRFPAISVDSESLFVSDGNVWSSAGVSAGIDLCLALIGEDHGKPAATRVARQLVMYMHRTGNQAQYSDSLAARMAMTPRHFTRLFRESFGEPPGRFLENLRLDRARALLSEHDARIEEVATAVGYASAASFRRAFERRFSMTPTQYRAHFTVPGSSEQTL